LKSEKVNIKRMTRSQIIEELYNSKEIKQALMKMHPANLREELKQEMFVNLCSITEDKFLSIYNNFNLTIKANSKSHRRYDDLYKDISYTRELSRLGKSLSYAHLSCKY
jgi:adenine C2-methylase RlmN of 23S rRNA A2503 and tRNA A37